MGRISQGTFWIKERLSGWHVGYMHKHLSKFLEWDM